MTGTVTKWLYLKLDDGRVYRIDAHLVAHDFANYYRDSDSDCDYGTEYNDVINDSDQLEDWAVGDMDWLALSEYVRTDYIDPQDSYVVDSWLEDGDD